MFFVLCLISIFHSRIHLISFSNHRSESPITTVSLQSQQSVEHHGSQPTWPDNKYATTLTLSHNPCTTIFHHILSPHLLTTSFLPILSPTLFPHTLHPPFQLIQPSHPTLSPCPRPANPLNLPSHPKFASSQPSYLATLSPIFLTHLDDLPTLLTERPPQLITPPPNHFIKKLYTLCPHVRCPPHLFGPRCCHLI